MRQLPFALAVFLCTIAALIPDRAVAACLALELEARVSDDLRRIEGTVTCHSGPVAPTSIALYPRVLREPAGLNDVNFKWHYPYGFDAAGIEVASGVAAVGNGSSAPWQLLADGVLTLRFTTTVPVRNGTFGIHQGTAYLLGGWHPAFGDGRWLRRQKINYAVSVPAGYVGLVGDRLLARGEQRRVVRGEMVARFLPLMLTREMSLDRRAGAVVLTPGHGATLQPREGFAREHLTQSLAAGASMARRSGIPTPGIIVVRGPILQNLIEPFDGGFMIGRRGFHLLPFEKFLKFHRAPVWRAQLGAYLLDLVAQREGPGAHLIAPTQIADAIAAALRDRIVLERYGSKETAADVLETVAFIPEIDALIFAPQTPFTDAYYEAIDESPTVRRRLDDFFHHGPRGKLFYEKLTDLLGAATVHALFDAYLYVDPPRPWLDVLAKNDAGVDVAAALAQWLGPYPRVDYGLGEIRGDDERITVEVHLTGPDAAAVREPVTVEIIDADGESHRITRDGPGMVTIDAAGPPDRVVLDPERRLVELHHEVGESPRFNNLDSARWRFLLNNITGLFALTGGRLIGAVDFGLRRIHDLRWAFRFIGVLDLKRNEAGAYEPNTYGGVTTATYAFGREVTPLSLAQRIGIGAAYERLTEVNSTTAVAAHQVSASLFYGYDDRLSPYWSYAGKGLRLRLIGALAWDDNGDDYQFAQVGASAFKIFPIASGHALLGRVSIDFEIGEAPDKNGLQLGDRNRGARGYERDEVTGKRRLIASAEYRHILTADERIDFWGLVTFTGIEGALFADVVNLPVERKLPGTNIYGCKQETFFDVGYGLRFMGDILNVMPATIQIDFGVPLNRCMDQRDRVPFTIYVALLQSFISF